MPDRIVSRNIRVATLLREIAEIAHRKHFARKPEFSDLTVDRMLEAWAITCWGGDDYSQNTLFIRRFGSKVHAPSGKTWAWIGQALQVEIEDAADEFAGKS